MTDIVTRAPNALLAVSTIIPITNTGTNQRVQQYNAAIPGLVTMLAGQGKHVIFVDSYAQFAKNANYATALMGDDLHPNTAGYA